MRVGNFICWRVGEYLPCFIPAICLAAACGSANVGWALPGTTNLAIGVTATATGADFGTSIGDALDGNRNGDFYQGSVFYENAIPESPPLFYQVDLGANAYIDRVQLLRRTDADQGVFGPMNLKIYQDDGAGNPGNVAFSHDYLPNYFGVGSWGTTDPGSTAAGGAAGGSFGRFVRLERLDNNYWLTFAEFEVIGAQQPLVFTEDNNIAAGKPVTVSDPGPGFGALASSGNDGNIDGSFGIPGYRPVYHSAQPGVGQTWQVDLGADTQLDHLQLFARGDNYTTSEFKVSVIKANQDVAGTFIVGNAPLTDPDPGYDHIINTAGLIGEYVRIETTQNEYLAFSELRAFAGPGSAFPQGDYNKDGAVNVRDYLTWRRYFGTTTNLDADGNGNGVVDGADYVIWRHSGAAAGAGSLVGSVGVPEPSSFVLALGMLPFVYRRRR